MFEYLSLLGNQIVGRYKTLENTIKCRSNSFYDSYLDLLEHTIKTILVAENVGYEGRTCGEILKEPDVINFFLHKVNMDNDVYEKCKNHIQKVNQHKHQNEKYINPETVISYMNLYHDIASSYASYKGIKVPSFNSEEIKAMYGITQKRSDELDIVKEHYDELSEMMRGELSSLGKKVQALEQQGTIRQKTVTQVNPTATNHKEILNRFLTTTKKSWRWFGNQRELNKSKFILFIATFCMIVFGVVSTVLSSISSGIYSTFTFFENLGVVCAIFIMVYGFKSKLLYRDVQLAHNSTSKYVKDKYNLWMPRREKRIFKIARWLAAISVILSIVFIWFNKNNLSGVATVFEILFLASIIFVRFADAALFAQYTIVYFEGSNLAKSETVTLVWDPMIKKFIPEEEYKRKMPFLY